MRSTYYILAITLIFNGSVVHASDNRRPVCYDVNVQINQNNNAKVQQNCEKNYSRTAQAGKNNSAETHQSGSVNNNTTRQYEYNATER